MMRLAKAGTRDRALLVGIAVSLLFVFSTVWLAFQQTGASRDQALQRVIALQAEISALQMKNESLQETLECRTEEQKAADAAQLEGSIASTTYILSLSSAQDTAPTRAAAEAAIVAMRAAIDRRERTAELCPSN